MKGGVKQDFKGYNNVMVKPSFFYQFLFLLLVMTFGFISFSCIPFGSPTLVKVIINMEEKELGDKSVVIPDFYVPEHGAGLGAGFADILQRNLLGKRIFRVVARDLPVIWTHPGETMESRFVKLSDSAAQKGYNYICIGVIDHLFYGGTGDSKLGATLRIIDTKSKTIKFMAENQIISSSKDPSYPLDTKLSKSADSPQQLAEAILRQIIARLK